MTMDINSTWPGFMAYPDRLGSLRINKELPIVGFSLDHLSSGRAVSHVQTRVTDLDLRFRGTLGWVGDEEAGGFPLGATHTFRYVSPGHLYLCPTGQAVSFVRIHLRDCFRPRVPDEPEAAITGFVWMEKDQLKELGYEI